SERLSGWHVLQGCERARGRHHDSGLPHYAAGTAEIALEWARRVVAAPRWRASDNRRRARLHNRILRRTQGGAAPRLGPESAIAHIVLPGRLVLFNRACNLPRVEAAKRTSLQVAGFVAS